jgi:hypothetical protein
MKRVDFVEMLVLVAQSCNFDLSEQLIAIYDQALAKNGYPKLCAALKHILINRRTRDPFPSIREVQEIVAPTLATKDQATDAAARIIASVSKFGRTNPGQAEAYIGELGWAAVKLYGGWNMLCEQLTVHNTSIVMAQFRELASTVIKKAELGLLDTPPSLPSGPDVLKALTGKIKSV